MLAPQEAGAYVSIIISKSLVNKCQSQYHPYMLGAYLGLWAFLICGYLRVVHVGLTTSFFLSIYIGRYSTIYST
jgi:hypothetical protein